MYHPPLLCPEHLSHFEAKLNVWNKLNGNASIFFGQGFVGREQGSGEGGVYITILTFASHIN